MGWAKGLKEGSGVWGGGFASASLSRKMLTLFYENAAF